MISNGFKLAMNSSNFDNLFHETLLRFEQAWTIDTINTGEPNLSDFYDVNTTPLDLLLQLCMIDLEKRIVLKSCSNTSFADYLKRFPELKNHPKAKLQLIRTEIIAIKATGKPVRTEMYVENYSIESSSLSDLAPIQERMEENSQFEIIKKIGQGGFGVVYLVKDFTFSKPIIVALKMLKTSDSSEKELLRFNNEAANIAQIRHQNVIQVFRYGIFKGHQFYTMEYCPETLADYVKDNPLDYRKAAEIISKAARGVGCAHNQNIIHRDIKPENILISFDGIPKVADFGLAKDLSSDQNLTLTGNLIGTKGFISPEQVLGGKIGPQSDVYSLGATLYRLITGNVPFPVGSEENLKTLLDKLAKEEPQPIRNVVRNVPRDLNNIIHKALNKNILKRYKNANELADDLDNFLEGKQVTARKIGYFERLERWIKTNPLLFAFIVSIMVFLLFLGIQNRKISIGSNNLVEALEETKKSREIAEINRKLAEEKSEEAERSINVAKAERNEASKQYENAKNLKEFIKYPKIMMELKKNNSSKAMELLESVPFSRRDWEHDFLYSLLAKENYKLFVNHNKSFQNVRLFCNDAKLFFNDSENAYVWNYKSAGSKPVKLKSLGEITHAFHSNTSEKLLLCISKSKLTLLSGEEIKLFDLKNNSEITSGCMIPEKNQAYIGYANGNICVVDLINHKKVHEFAAHQESVEFMEFNSLSQNIISAGKDGRLKVWNTNENQIISPLKNIPIPSQITSFSVNPNGTEISILDHSGLLKILTLKTGRLKWAKKLDGNMQSKINFTRDGRKLILANHDGFRIFDSFDGMEIKHQKKTSGLQSFDLSADGGFLIGGTNDLYIYNLENSWDYQNFKNTSKAPLCFVTFDQNNRMLLVFGDGSMKIKSLQGFKNKTSVTDDIELNLADILKKLLQNLGLRFLSTQNPKFIFSNHAPETESKVRARIPNTNRYIKKDGSSLIIMDDGMENEILTLTCHDEDISCIGISNDGKLLVVGLKDGWVKIFLINLQMPHYKGPEVEGDERETLFKPRDKNTSRISEIPSNTNQSGEILLMDFTIEQKNQTGLMVPFFLFESINPYFHETELRSAMRDNDSFGIKFYNKNILKNEP